jgi:hypothetical protein
MAEQQISLTIKRFPQNPIICPNMDARMGSNINGPSLIRAPEWLGNPLGRYYLYFAHHQGTYIRLAYTDRLEGPWTTYEPGTLRLDQTPCVRHIASPDLHIDDKNRRLIMYYHGPVEGRGQCSFVATSTDGLHFDSGDEILGTSYFRAFRWGGYTYALSMPGIMNRSRDGFTDFQQGPTLYSPDMRHTALKLDGDTLSVFYSNAHDCPERILLSQIELTPDWLDWTPTEPVTVLEPEMGYEGVHLALEPSERGWAPEPVRQVRDPAIYREGERTYLLYTVAGERGIAIAEIVE